MKLTELKRKNIVDAAIAEFREQGFLGANTTRIAKRAGVSSRTLYNHFESKEELFHAITEIMIGWWISAGQAVFGDTIFAVRALVVFSGLVGSLALWRTAAILFDQRTAGWAVLFLNASLLVGIGGILATPDAPSVVFWGLTFWALAELSRSGNANWWLVVGLMAGCGLLSKYSVLFLGAGIVVWLLWVPEARRWWSAWQLWAGGLVALLCFSPVLYWNHLHERSWRQC